MNIRILMLTAFAAFLLDPAGTIFAQSNQKSAPVLKPLPEVKPIGGGGGGGGNQKNKAAWRRFQQRNRNRNKNHKPKLSNADKLRAASKNVESKNWTVRGTIRMQGSRYYLMPDSFQNSGTKFYKIQLDSEAKASLTELLEKTDKYSGPYTTASLSDLLNQHLEVSFTGAGRYRGRDTVVFDPGDITAWSKMKILD
jgi:hypothetical protein